MTETAMDRIRACEHAASRVNPDSPHRKELRRLLRWHELDAANALIVLDRIALLDPRLGPMDIHELVRDARAALEPFHRGTPK